MNTGSRSDSAYKHVVLEKCYGALEAVGFTRYRKGGVDWPLGSNFHCWVGLNAGLRPEYIEINPFVGVHVVSIEKLWTSKKIGKYPGKYDRGVATYAVHMGELVPNEPAFRFSWQTDVEEEAARLARLYVSVGLDYAQLIASYEQLLPLLYDRVPMLGGYPERVAVCLYLMDRKEEAHAFVEGFLKERRDYFEGFAVSFLKLLKS